MRARSVPCRACGSPVPRQSAFCPTCGVSVDPSDTRTMPPTESVIEPPAAAQAAREIVLSPSVPGSYLRPSSVFQSLAAPPGQVSMPLAGTVAPAGSTATGNALRALHTPAAESPRQPGDAVLLADLPFDAPDTLAEWLVAIGSGVSALSFLLPWTPRIANYTSSWGLSTPANLVVLALLIGTLVLAILPNRVAIWVRAGVLGLIGGSLLLGVLWSYILGDFGAEFGAFLGAVAAIVLIAGGVLAVAPRQEPPPV